MKVEIHDRLEAIGSGAWDELVAACRLRSPFLTWTWQYQWVHAFAEGCRLEIRAVKDPADRLVALLPLYEVEPGLLRLVGGADVSDYLDLIAVDGREEQAWTALLQARAADRARWRLHAVPAASPTVTALPALAAACALEASSTVEERCPVLTLPESWEAYLDTLSGKHRHEIRRKLRRFEREQPDARVTQASAPADIAERLGDFLALHRLSRVGKAKFMDARMEAFFRAALPALAASGAARLWLLETGQGPIASFICLEWDGGVGLYNSGFDPGCAALSPGLVLLTHVIRDAMARGCRRFDFLRGEERYKYEFGPTPEDVHCVEIGPVPS
ncbi:MAG: GNAT family N-acetyltransferase [Candidatus Rokuibacteriota bacterium]